MSTANLARPDAHRQSCLPNHAKAIHATVATETHWPDR
jgi:hypothetical protein